MWQSQRKVCERFLQTFFYAWPTITVTEVGNWQGYKRYVALHLAKSTNVAITGEGEGKILNIPTPRPCKGRMVVIADSLSYSWSRSREGM